MRGRRMLVGWLVAAAAIGILAWTVGRPVEWPAITDPAALRREATALCREAGGWRELQPAEYPMEMTRTLHPASISVSHDRVYVALVPVPGGKRFHGYSIWPETVRRPEGGIAREESNDAP